MIKKLFNLVGERIKDSFHQLKNPKAIMPTIIIGVLWLILSLLNANGISNQFLYCLNLITFSEGGMFGGIFGAIGGIIGKVIILYVINIIILSIRYKEKIFKNSFNTIINNSKIRNKKDFTYLLFGIGISLILCYIFNLSLNKVNISISIYLIIYVITSYKDENSFLSKLLNILFKNSKKIMIGMIAGLIITFVTTYVQIYYLSFYIGVFVLILSFIIKMSSGKNIVTIFLIILFSITYVNAETSPMDKFSNNGYTFRGNVFTEFNDNKYNEGIFELEYKDENGKFGDPGYIIGYGTSIAKLRFKYHYVYPDEYSNYGNYSDIKRFEVPLPGSSMMDESIASIDLSISESFLVYINDEKLQESIKLGINYNCKEYNQEEINVEGRRTIKVSCFDQVETIENDAISYKDAVTYYVILNEPKVNGASMLMVINIDSDGGSRKSIYDSSNQANIKMREYISWEKETHARIVKDLVNGELTYEVESYIENGQDKTNDAMITGKKINRSNDRDTSNRFGVVGTIVIGISTILIFLSSGIPPVQIKKEYLNVTNDGDLEIKDPATGEKTLYVLNKDGTYTSPLSGYNYTGEDLIEQIKYRERYKNEIAKEFARNKEFNKSNLGKLSKFGKKVQDDYRKAIKKAEHDMYLDKLKYKYGLDDDVSEKDIKKFLINKRVKEEKDYFELKAKEDYIDAGQNIAETAESIADYSMAIGEAVVPGGKIVSATYKGAKNVLGTAADKGWKSGLTEGLIKGAAEAGSTLMDNGMTKVAVTIGGETIGSAAGAAVRGEDIVNATKKGLAKGTGNAAAGVISDQMGDVGGKAAGAIGNTTSTYYGKNVLDPKIEKSFNKTKHIKK